MKIEEILFDIKNNPQNHRKRISAFMHRAQKAKQSNIFIRLFEPQGIGTDLDPGKPLSGLTFSVKDNIAVKGYPTSLGIKPPAVNQASDDSDVLKFILASGATLLGTTNLDPGCLSCRGDNPYYGDVLNPKYLDSIPAGSSSGAAAAVAGELCDFSIGTDFAGSVRAPAAAGGASAIKLSPNLISHTGIVGWVPELDSIGIIARNLEDLKFLLHILFPNLEYRDTAGFALRTLSSDARSELGEGVDHELEKVISGLERKGIEVQGGDYFDFGRIDAMRKVLSSVALAQVFRELNINTEDFDEIKAVELFAAQQSKERLKEIRLELEELREAASKIINTSSLYLTPTLPVKLPKRKDPQHSLPEQQLNYLLSLANLLGFPALSFPVNKDTLDFSLQLIGPPGSDRMLVEIALKIQKS